MNGTYQFNKGPMKEGKDEVKRSELPKPWQDKQDSF